MALLAYCWLIVESFVVPHGFLKWFYLSFYIHPVILIFCQVFLWLNELIKLLIFLLHHLTVLFRLSFFVFRVILTVVFALFSYIRPAKVDVFYDALEPDAAQISPNDCEIVVSCRKSRPSPSLQVGYNRVESRTAEKVRAWRLYPNLDATFEATEEMNHDYCLKDSWLNEFLNSDRYSSSLVIDDDSMFERSFSGESAVSASSNDLTTTTPFHLIVVGLESSNEAEDSAISPSIFPENIVVSPDPSFDSNHALPAADEQQFITSRETEDIDPFHRTYESRMKFFNVLYHERLQGINAISNESSSSPSFFDSIEASTDYPMQYKLWGKMARKRLLRSLECDIEMICVAQSCLFWEALDHQYHKVESFILSDNCGNIFFEHEISRKFQEVQILLERFVEDQSCEGQRSSNNITGRLSFQALLLVPDVTGFVVTMRGNRATNEDYYTRPTELLEAINSCIEAFWSYIRRDEKKSFWKSKGIWRTRPPVEDPQDLQLLYDVMKILHKKWVMVRGVEGKSKCWVRRKVKPMQAEDAKRNLLFATIDVKLVHALLKMPLVSKSHLQWCQQKLENLELIRDKVFRGRITHLFPTS